MNGGGVHVDSGTFTMSGGTITGNTATEYGGGMGTHGTFTLTGGTITINDQLTDDAKIGVTLTDPYKAGVTPTRAQAPSQPRQTEAISSTSSRTTPPTSS